MGSLGGYAWLVVAWVVGCAAARPPAAPVVPAAPAAPIVEPVRSALAEPRCTASHSELDRLAPKSGVTIAAEDRVTLRRGACFGSCPVYSVTLFGDGRVVAEGRFHVATTGAQEWTIDPELARRVLGELVRVEVFSRKAMLLGHISDLPSAELEVRVGKKSALISHSGAGAELQWQMGGKDNALITQLERLVDQATEAQTRVVGCSVDR